MAALLLTTGKKHTDHKQTKKEPSVSWHYQSGPMTEVKQVLYTQPSGACGAHCAQKHIHYIQQAHMPPKKKKNTDRGRQLLSDSARELHLLSAAARSSIFHLRAGVSHWVYIGWEEKNLLTIPSSHFRIKGVCCWGCTEVELPEKQRFATSLSSF